MKKSHNCKNVNFPQNKYLYSVQFQSKSQFGVEANCQLFYVSSKRVKMWEQTRLFWIFFNIKNKPYLSNKNARL